MGKIAKRKHSSLVVNHLEKIGSAIFERYHKEIMKRLQGQYGVYALYKNDKLYYIGKASNFKNRITVHLNDKHAQKWDNFSLYMLKAEHHIKEIEALLLRIAFPKGNSQKGRLAGSKSLGKLFEKQLREQASREIRSFFASQSKRKTKKKRTKRSRSKDKPLRDVFPQGKRLYTNYKGKQYKAWVFRSGTVKVNGKLYDSPSSAGKAVRKGKSTNGWAFWKYKDNKGNLVKLKNVRKRT